jgi:hypothetical protein
VASITRCQAQEETLSKHDDLIRKIQERAQADRQEVEQLIAGSGLESNSTLVNALEPEFIARAFRDLKEEILADMFGSEASSEDTSSESASSEEKKPWYKFW